MKIKDRKEMQRTGSSQSNDGFSKRRKSADLAVSRSLILNRRSGFTLVELVVAIGLFSLLISIAIGGFIQALRSERQAAALMGANSTVSLALEQMAREIRAGTNFSLPSPSELRFTNALGQAVGYCLNAGLSVLERDAGGACGSGQPLTPPNTMVRALNFIASGVSPGSQYPPRITIDVSLSARGDPGVQSSVVNVQTTVSARNL